ncbi:MAG: hypothetical protein ACTS5I_10830 [Rhodanobacter sp.]
MSNELNIDLGQTGLTVTASVYLLGVAKATGIACAEIGVTGKYSGDFTATPNVAGVYQVAFFNGAETVSSGGGQINWDGAAEILPTGDSFARIGALGAGLTAITDQVWDEAISGHAVAGSTGATLSSAAVPAAGAGAIVWTYTLTNANTGLPIADADVWITSDSAGANVLASGRTNASGVVTFALDAGEIFVWRQKSGWNFTNPDGPETVA